MKAQVAPSRRPVPSRPPTTWPHEVRAGDVTLKIYRTNTTVGGRTYENFTLVYFADGKRIRKQFADFEKARKLAATIAEQKAQGALGAAALTAEARVALQEALQTVAKSEGTGNATLPRLITIVRDYAAAVAELPEGGSLVEAARFYKLRCPDYMQHRTVPEVVDEFIEDRRGAGCSGIHLRDLETRLRSQFASTFSLPISSMCATQVQQWVYSLKNSRTKTPASPRTKQNMIRAVASLFHYARRMKYVPRDLALEMAEIPVPKNVPSPIGIYTPAEIAAILAAADPEVVPALAICAFAGLRLAEVSRLDWRDVKWTDRQIAIEAHIAKTAARRLVPICENLALWLSPYVRLSGPINPCQEDLNAVGNALGDRFERAAARAKVAWKRNGLRHSYISYRVATLKNVPEVALECGNSAKVIFSNYRAVTTEAQGMAWFAVRPPQPKATVIAGAEGGSC